ncbi:MAG: 30S ribosome-binding factor RbfA [Candidatus Dormiibacterota bacterium]
MTLRPGARSPRRERVGEQLREEISAMMLTELKDPRVRLASISRVRVSPDLREAWLAVSALGDDPDRQNVVAALSHAEGFLRAQLGRRLENLRSIPRLHFELDESIAYSVRVSTLLRDLEEERPVEAAVEVPE